MNHLKKHIQENTIYSPIASKNCYYQCEDCNSSIPFQVDSPSMYIRILEHILEHVLERRAKA